MTNVSKATQHRIPSSSSYHLRFTIIEDLVSRNQQLGPANQDFYDMYMSDKPVAMNKETMKSIPIKEAKFIAQEYGYDQVIIYARRCDGSAPPLGEYLTTYGVTKQHCNIAGRIGSFLKREIFKWPKSNEV